MRSTCATPGVTSSSARTTDHRAERVPSEMDCVRRRSNVLTRSQGKKVSAGASWSNPYFEKEVGMTSEHIFAEIKHDRKQAIADVHRRVRNRSDKIAVGIDRIKEKELEIVQAIGRHGAVVKSALICERGALGSELGNNQAMAQQPEEEEY